MLQTEMLTVRLLHHEPNLHRPRSQESAFEYETFREILRATDALQDDKSWRAFPEQTSLAPCYSLRVQDVNIEF